MIRIRSISSAIKMRAEERADERIRIARDLHDTLLQGVQGLMMTFHVVAESYPSNEESQKAMAKALTSAERVVIEGRNRVNDLRSERLTEAKLLDALEKVCADLNASQRVTCHIRRTGLSETLRSNVVDEIFAIGREALNNAIRHSQALNIDLELTYNHRSFTMSCRDNGAGFDSESIEVLPKHRHWGLLGMAERAETIGGKFICSSSRGKGTTVIVQVPAHQAYVRSSLILQFWETLKLGHTPGNISK
jgi:signal transduction histidine kinase